MQSAILNVMTKAALKAGNSLLRDFGEVDKLQVSQKGPANFVTKADIRVEKMLVTELLKARPDYGFLLEEQGEIKGTDNEYRWIIDPLDGTNNFIHAIPYFCTSIALEKRAAGKSEIIAGVIYDPIHNELFCAEKGQGATVNDRRLNVSPRKNLNEAMMVSGYPNYMEEPHYRMLRNSCASNACIRYLGAAALDLAYVAAGRLDAVWLTRFEPWDIAAAWLIIKEARGMVTEIDGNSATLHSNTLLATNSHLHNDVRKLLADGDG